MIIWYTKPLHDDFTVYTCGKYKIETGLPEVYSKRTGSLQQAYRKSTGNLPEVVSKYRILKYYTINIFFGGNRHTSNVIRFKIYNKLLDFFNHNRATLRTIFKQWQLYDNNSLISVCHSEMNAILNRISSDVRGCTLYVTLFPCNQCAKIIIQAGIAEVVYYDDKHFFKIETEASKLMLEKAGVKTRFA